MSVPKSILQVPRSLILGTLGAALLGGLFALEFDRLAAIAVHLTGPVGQAALLQGLGAATLAGGIVWAACLLVSRAISRHAVSPYLVLTDQLEALADGHPQDLPSPSRQAPNVQRLARLILTVQDDLMASHRETADLRARYDALCDANARERQSLMAILMEKATGRIAPPLVQPPLQPVSAITFAIPDRPAALRATDPRPALLAAPIELDDSFGPLRLGSRNGAITAH